MKDFNQTKLESAGHTSEHLCWRAVTLCHWAGPEPRHKHQEWMRVVELSYLTVVLYIEWFYLSDDRDIWTITTTGSSQISGSLHSWGRSTAVTFKMSGHSQNNKVSEQNQTHSGRAERQHDNTVSKMRKRFPVCVPLYSERWQVRANRSCQKAVAVNLNE